MNSETTRELLAKTNQKKTMRLKRRRREGERNEEKLAKTLDFTQIKPEAKDAICSSPSNPWKLPLCCPSLLRFSILGFAGLDLFLVPNEIKMVGKQQKSISWTQGSEFEMGFVNVCWLYSHTKCVGARVVAESLMLIDSLSLALCAVFVWIFVNCAIC